MAKAEQLYEQTNQDGIQDMVVAGCLPHAAVSDEGVEGVGFVESNRLYLGAVNDPDQRKAAG